MFDATIFVIKDFSTLYSRRLRENISHLHLLPLHLHVPNGKKMFLAKKKRLAPAKTFSAPSKTIAGLRVVYIHFEKCIC